MKEKCTNHPNKNSLSFCHSCGKYFCEDCLDVGEEYYYCKEEKCQEDIKAAFLEAARAAKEAYKAGNKEGVAKEKAKMDAILEQLRERKAMKIMDATIEGKARSLAELEAQKRFAELDEGNRAQKIRAIRDEFGLADTDMKKISWENPVLLSQSEFDLYLNALRQRAFKLADNKFEKERMDLDKMSKEQLKASIKQKNKETAGDIKERVPMKTIKELNEKVWFRFFKVLYILLAIPYIPLLFWRKFFEEINKKAWHRSLKALYVLLVIPYTHTSFLILLEDILKIKFRTNPYIVAFIVDSTIYFLMVEFLRRVFYYVILGKVFPKE